MAETTAIEWADRTWSPWEGCTKVSLAEHGGGGCDNCYAARRNAWLHRGENWGPGAPRRLTADWSKPVLWNRQAAKAGKRLTVFPSICDPFDNEVPAEWRARFFRLIDDTPHLTWLLLTKRIGNVKAMVAHGPFCRLPNVWLGATVVNQAEADRDIPKLLAMPARVRFLSIEPMLGAIDVRWAFSDAGVIRCPRCMFATNDLGHGPCPNDGATLRNDPGVHWIIAGGESGPKARPAHPDWFRSLRDQCAAAGVPFLFKQWGEFTTPRVAGVPVSRLVGHDRVPGYAFDDGALVVRIGKAAAGRLLDGRTHDGFPPGETQA